MRVYLFKSWCRLSTVVAQQAEGRQQQQSSASTGLPLQRRTLSPPKHHSASKFTYPDMQIVLFCVLLLTAAGPRHTAAAASSDATARLEAAARSNDVAAARQAIKDNADLNAQGGGGQTPIMAATLAGSTDIVRFLLDEHSTQIDFSIGEQDGYTPMHGAGFQGRADIATLLIAAGLDPSDRHKDGYTPIHRACWGRQQHHTDTVRALLESGKVDVNELANGITPLDAALGSGNDATVALLKSQGGRTASDITEREL